MQNKSNAKQSLINNMITNKERMNNMSNLIQQQRTKILNLEEEKNKLNFKNSEQENIILGQNNKILNLEFEKNNLINKITILENQMLEKKNKISLLEETQNKTIKPKFVFL